MGLDVYLKWEKQTEKEEKEQITGFDLASGHKGYLRASYNSSMEIECKLLYALWNTGEEEFEYNFLDQNNISRMNALISAYESLESYYEPWSKSVREFFDLGKKKNLEGRKTSIILSG